MSDGHPLDSYPEDETGDERIDTLALVDRARVALEQARTLTDIGAVMDVAERARRYAKAANLGRAAENHAASLRLESERRAGEYLRDNVPHEGGRPGEKPSQIGTVFPTLSDLAITRRQSSDWQLVARVPEPIFREHVDRITTAQRPLTTAGLVEVARRIKRLERAAETKPIAVLARHDVRVEVADATALPLDDESVDLIVTSPPYGLDVGYELGDVVADEWPEFMVAWLDEALRVTRPSGRLALNIPLDTSEPTYRPAYAQSIMAALAAGWAYRSTVVWHEGNTTKGGWALGSQASAARPHHVSQVEMIALFSRGEWAPSSDNADDITPEEFLVAGRGPWTFGGETRPWEGHPAAFPRELPARLIPYLSRVGDVVLDPFCGSGTTLLAAVERGRRAIGFDVSRAYVESARRRLSGRRDSL